MTLVSSSGGCSGPCCAGVWLWPGGIWGIWGIWGIRYLPGAPSGSELSSGTFGYAVSAGAACLLWCQGEASVGSCPVSGELPGVPSARPGWCGHLPPLTSAVPQALQNPGVSWGRGHCGAPGSLRRDPRCTKTSSSSS